MNNPPNINSFIRHNFWCWPIRIDFWYDRSKASCFWCSQWLQEILKIASIDWLSTNLKPNLQKLTFCRLVFRHSFGHESKIVLCLSPPSPDICIKVVMPFDTSGVISIFVKPKIQYYSLTHYPLLSKPLQDLREISCWIRSSSMILDSWASLRRKSPSITDANILL